MLYLAARFASEAFYRSVGVTPEEVGVSTVSLLVAAGSSALLLVILAVVVVQALRFALARPGLRRVVLGSLGAGLGFAVARDPAGLVIGIIAGLATAAAISSRRRAWSPFLHDLRVRVVAVAALAVAALAGGAAHDGQLDRRP